ncbi:ABC transporter permease [Dactylosporangium sp. NPDC005572]|uniref:ABC transporter permease n=1 Tax=Dactylosporangium sp. NPDC005572 TaxID=3156889 RepID=UPI0033A41464
MSKTETPVETPVAAPARHVGAIRRSLRLTRTRVGLACVLLVLAIAVLGPLFAPHSTTEFVGAPFQPPGPDYLLGTDRIGRDVLSRFLAGGKLLIFISLLSTVIGVGAGAVLGLLAAQGNKLLDEIIMRFCDLKMSFPGIVLSLLVITVLGKHLPVLVGVVALDLAPHAIRVVRSATVQVREADFVRYAEGNGTSASRVMFQEILPNIASPLTVEFAQRLTYAIGSVAGLAYLGLGVQPPTADWGVMIQENQVGLTATPLAVLVPVVAVVVVTVGANLVADGFALATAGIEDRT